MYFDRVVNVYDNGVKAVLISPKRKQCPILIKLQFECTNNIIGYEA
jgi:hypothetical protein